MTAAFRCVSVRSAAMDCAVANTSDLAHRQVAEDLSGAVAGGCGYVAAALTDLSAFDPQNPESRSLAASAGESSYPGP